MSLQAAPFDASYRWNDKNGAGWFNEEIAEKNSFRGGIYQQAFSGVVNLDDDIFENAGGRFGEYGVEWKPGSGPDAYATWSVDKKQPAWRVHAKGLAGNA